MGDRSAIEWTDATWNPIRGCTRVSEGCRNCYAERVAARFSGPGMAYEGLATMRNGEPRWTGVVRLIPEHLMDPLHWIKPRRVFVNSMSDLFHESLDDATIDQVFAVMAACDDADRGHVFQILTKRPERMRDYVRAMLEPGARIQRFDQAASVDHRGFNHLPSVWPLPNVWLGVSAEDQATADVRIPFLLHTPAAVRFLSAEPLLGSMHGLNQWLGDWADSRPMYIEGVKSWTDPDAPPDPRIGPDGFAYGRGLDWVIVGGESGPGARPMRYQWAASIADQCRLAGVAFFFKQWGEHGETGVRVGKKAAGRLLDGRTWDQFPNMEGSTR